MTTNFLEEEHHSIDRNDHIPFDQSGGKQGKFTLLIANLRWETTLGEKKGQYRILFLNDRLSNSCPWCNTKIILQYNFSLTVVGGCIHGSPSICMGKVFLVLIKMEEHCAKRLPLALNPVLT